MYMPIWYICICQYVCVPIWYAYANMIYTYPTGISPPLRLKHTAHDIDLWHLHYLIRKASIVCSISRPVTEEGVSCGWEPSQSRTQIPSYLESFFTFSIVKWWQKPWQSDTQSYTQSIKCKIICMFSEAHHQTKLRFCGFWQVKSLLYLSFSDLLLGICWLIKALLYGTAAAHKDSICYNLQTSGEVSILDLANTLHSDGNTVCTRVGTQTQCSLLLWHNRFLSFLFKNS